MVRQKVKVERLKVKVTTWDLVRMLQNLKKFSELNRNEQLLFSEAFFLQLTIGLLLKTMPFKWIPKLFSSPQSSVISPQSSFLELMRTATNRASRVSPWKNKCLVSSLAARRILNRRKIQSQLSLGVAKGANGKMIAHAWLKVGDFEIVEKGLDFSELYLF